MDNLWQYSLLFCQECTVVLYLVKSTVFLKTSFSLKKLSPLKLRSIRLIMQPGQSHGQPATIIRRFAWLGSQPGQGGPYLPGRVIHLATQPVKPAEWLFGHDQFSLAIVVAVQSPCCLSGVDCTTTLLIILTLRDRQSQIPTIIIEIYWTWLLILISATECMLFLFFFSASSVRIFRRVQR